MKKLTESLLKLWGQDIFVLPHLQTHYLDVSALEKGIFPQHQTPGGKCFAYRSHRAANQYKKKGEEEKGKAQEPISLHELFNTEWPLLLRADGEVC